MRYHLTAFFKHFFIFSIVIFCVTLVEFFYLGKPLTGIDDANIFLNYAHHFSNGEGFVYNTHGERVEGFTSMLWVLICAAFFLLSAHPEFILLIICFLLTVTTVTFAYEEVSKDVKQLNESFYKKHFLWLYTVFLICIGPLYFAWSVLSLMENALWNFLFTTLVISILQYSKTNISLLKKTIVCLLAILLVLTRPEAYAWNILFFFLFIIITIKNKRSVLFSLAYLILSITAILFMANFRIHYFGYPLPNTYYAKVSPDKFYNIKEGLIYAINFITDSHPVIILFITALLVVTVSLLLNKKFKLQSPTEIGILIITLIICISLCLPLTTGGDHFAGFRFYQDIILLSVWAIPAMLIIHRDAVFNRFKYAILSWQLIAIIFFVFIGSGTLFNLKHPLQTQLNYEFDFANTERIMGEDMNDVWRDSAQRPSVGVIFAGGFALKYNGTTIDLMGLNNTLMGHSSGDRIGIKNHAAFNKLVFYKLNPDIILPEQVTSDKQAYIEYVQLLSEENFFNKAMKNIFNDLAFQQNYYPVTITNKLNRNKIFLFANKDFYQELQKNNLLQLKNL